jgi:hypothetical protein
MHALPMLHYLIGLIHNFPTEKLVELRVEVFELSDIIWQQLLRHQDNQDCLEFA